MSEDDEKKSDPRLRAELLGDELLLDAYPIDTKMWRVTDALKEAGHTDEEMMLAYFNECVRVTCDTRGVIGGYILICQLYWHIVGILKKLRATNEGMLLQALPEDPTVPKPGPAKD